MNIFLSWSGERSQKIAEALKKWLPFFIQAVKPWMSSNDIDKGRRWSAEIASQLEDCKIGIICLTPENMNAPWILFEAGALSKTLETSHVCPFIVDLDPSDIKGPLVQFQTTKFAEEDFKKLIKTLNGVLADPVPEAQIDVGFSNWWPQLKAEIDGIPKPESPLAPKREDRELLEEILEIVRQLSRDSDPSERFDLSKQTALEALWKASLAPAGGLRPDDRPAPSPGIQRGTPAPAGSEARKSFSNNPFAALKNESRTALNVM